MADDAAMLAPDWLAERAALTPDSPALFDFRSDSWTTYEQWNRRANQTAHALLHAGLRRGDRLALLSTNCPEYLDILFACNKTGIILQSLNWRLAAPELATVVADGAPELLLFAPEFEVELPARSLPLPDLGVASHPDTFDSASLSVSDPWVICYTGGSTGTPKGAVLTHGNILWNAINTVASWGLGANDRTLLDAPLFHTGGLNVFTTPLVWCGGASVVCPKFEPDLWFERVQRFGVTVYFGVPTMFQDLAARPSFDSADLSSLRFLISGGAPCPKAVFERYLAKGVEFRSGYGLTEAGPNTFWLPQRWVRDKAGLVGRPLLNVQLKLMDTTEVLNPNQVGELWVRGPHVTPGYWRQPEATAQVLDADGWFHTGDLASRDADGCYEIRGRKKEMFISGGENVYPAEVESVLSLHPAVAEAAVLGRPDPRWGEVGHAFVALRGRATEKELIEFLRARLAAYKVPKQVSVLTALPRTGAQKIDKLALGVLVSKT